MSDLYLSMMRKAYELAQGSPDPSTQNAAIIVEEYNSGIILSTGINEFPRGVKYSDGRWVRPDKYRYVEHAERNAVYSAARTGRFVAGATMVSPWAACTDCARGIIQAGIVKLVRHAAACESVSDFWQLDHEIADTMLSEAGVEIIDLEWSFGDIEIRRWEKIWKP